LVEKVFRCDIKVKLVLSVLCLELLFNALAKNFLKKHFQRRPPIHIYIAYRSIKRKKRT
jgi:hypothetical protein